MKYLSIFLGLGLAASACAQSMPDVFTGIISEVRSDGTMVIVRSDVDPQLKPLNGVGVRRVKTRFWGLTLGPKAADYVTSHYLNRTVGVEIHRHEKTGHFVWGEVSHETGHNATDMINLALIYDGVATWNRRQAPGNKEFQKATIEAPKFRRLQEQVKRAEEARKH